MNKTNRTKNLIDIYLISCRFFKFTLNKFKTGMPLFLLLLGLFSFGFSQNIHRAVSEGNLEEVEALLKKNQILVNEEDARGCTPLFTAIIRRNQEMVKLLIQKGASVRVGDSNLRAPIHFAGFMNDPDMINLLLENGAVIDTSAIGGATPLIHSSMADLFSLSRFLLEHGADINIQCNALTTPLYFAVLNNNLEYLTYLIEKGADTDTPDFLNRTPLYVAIRDGYINITEKLMEHGAEIRYQGLPSNKNFLHLAAIRGRKETADLLIRKGFNVNEQDENGWTPLDYALRYGQFLTAEFLKKRGGIQKAAENVISAKNLLNQTLKSGEAVIIKLQNGSWGICTQKHFLIFAYSEIGRPSPDKSITNGYLTGDEMKDAAWIYFDLGFHPLEPTHALQGRTPVYSMQDRMEHLSFILNISYDRNYSRLNLTHAHFPKSGQPITVEGLKITVIDSYQNQKGYFIEGDGLVLFWLAGLCDNYISTKKDAKAVTFVGENLPKVDLLFLGTPDGIGPEKGNGIREAYLESIILNPKAVFFMGKELLERKILNQIRRRIGATKNIICADNPGDVFRFFLKK
ncbi:MAG: ankyrin repeat domain-containing protein [Candidatus Aminicenantes bacterium]|nr:ankyrin repeat domain-containing protein [Candidatus Aminicenantes bacterium]